MAERSVVQFGKSVIPFEVRRRARRRQVTLVVQAGQRGVLVLAPLNAPMSRLTSVVRQRAQWVLDKLRQVEGVERARQAREFVSGEGFTYLGRSFRLALEPVEGPAVPSARMERGWLVVSIPRSFEGTARARAVRKAVVAWFRERAAARLPDRLARFTHVLGRPMPPILLRDQARRWGSCNEKGEVRINWRILQAPMVLVDYVLAHEAVHLKHRNHTRAFWTELARLVPDVESRRLELRKRGSAYVW